MNTKSEVIKLIPGWKRGFWTMARKEAAIGYLLMVPGFIFLTVIIGYPLVNSIWLSFTDLNLLKGLDSGKFIGLQNYINFLKDPNLKVYLRNQAVWVIGITFLPVLTGLVYAILLNRQIVLRGFFRGIVLLPWVMPMIVSAIAWRWIYNGDWGVLNFILIKLGIIKEGIPYLINRNTLWPAILISAIWRWFPFNYVVILAALQAISNDLYEAAEVDGASEWHTFWKITFPLILPVLIVLLVLGMVWSMNDFTNIWVLTMGGPGIDSTTLAPLVYRISFEFFKMGYGATIAVVLMVFSLIITYFYIRRVRFDE